jgi:hypothetical protein
MTKEKNEKIKQPENTEYNFEQIEVNVLTKNNIIHTQVVSIEDTSFKYDNFSYTIDSDKIYLYPTNKGYMQTLFYNKKVAKPISFENKNKGIPSRALHLLWNHTLYKVLVALENDKTNLIVIILLIIVIALNGFKAYFGLW